MRTRVAHDPNALTRALARVGKAIKARARVEGGNGCEGACDEACEENGGCDWCVEGVAVCKDGTVLLIEP